LETEELIAHVVSQAGSCDIFEVPTGERAAVLTFIPFEYENLRQFGDVAFLDGTMVKKALGWTLFPITLINESYQTVFAGLLSTAFETESIFDWILRPLEHQLSGILRTIVTDEDFAFICSMMKFHLGHPGIGHHLCVFDKRRNFQNKLNTVTKDPKMHAEARRLFQKVAYDRRSNGVDETIVQLKLCFPHWIIILQPRLPVAWLPVRKLIVGQFSGWVSTILAQQKALGR
jgi:hypothetical protein